MATDSSINSANSTADSAKQTAAQLDLLCQDEHHRIDIESARLNWLKKMENLQDITKTVHTNNQSIELNKKKAIVNKIHDLDRCDIEVVQTGGGTRILCSTLFFELLKPVLLDYYSEKLEKDSLSEICLTKDISGTTYMATLKIQYPYNTKEKNAGTNRLKSVAKTARYTLNMYLTTSSFLANGPDCSRFLVDLQTIIDSVKKEYGRLRMKPTVMKDKLRHVLQKSLEKCSVSDPSQSRSDKSRKPVQVRDVIASISPLAEDLSTNAKRGGVASSSINTPDDCSPLQNNLLCPSEELPRVADHQPDDNHDESEAWICPACGKSAETDSIQCEVCLLWYHFLCENIDNDQARKMDDCHPYSCAICRTNQLHGQNNSTGTLENTNQTKIPARAPSEASCDQLSQGNSSSNTENPKIDEQLQLNDMVRALEEKMKKLEANTKKKDNEIKYLKDQNSALQTHSLKLESTVKSLHDSIKIQSSTNSQVTPDNTRRCTESHANPILQPQQIAQGVFNHPNAHMPSSTWTPSTNTEILLGLKNIECAIQQQRADMVCFQQKWLLNNQPATNPPLGHLHPAVNYQIPNWHQGYFHPPIQQMPVHFPPQNFTPYHPTWGYNTQASRLWQGHNRNSQPHYRPTNGATQRMEENIVRQQGSARTTGAAIQRPLEPKRGTQGSNSPGLNPNLSEHKVGTDTPGRSSARNSVQECPLENHPKYDAGRKTNCLKDTPLTNTSADPIDKRSGESPPNAHHTLGIAKDAPADKELNQTTTVDPQPFLAQGPNLNKPPDQVLRASRRSL